MNNILAITDLNFSLFYENFTTNIIFNIALLLSLGIIGGKIAHQLKLPKVTGYIIIGMIFGPTGLNFLTEEALYSFKIFKILALGFIGFNIGMELNFISLKKVGKHALLIALVQAFLTFVLVASVVYLLADDYKMTYALIFGAIATVTTPAPIVACMKSYNVRGKLANLICPIVALDDIIGIILFALILPISIYLAGHVGEVINFTTLMVGPLLEIGFSVLIGALIGLILVLVLKRFRKGDTVSIMMILVIGLFLGISIGDALEASAILLPLTIGVLVINGLDQEFLVKVKSTSDSITMPLLLVFFTISGAGLDIALLPSLGVLGLAYILVRIIGKVIGTYLASRALKEGKTVSTYMGIALIPQGGVAIDMAILAEARFLQLYVTSGNYDFEIIATTILSIILAATVIYKVFGEIIVKWAFKKAGEIHKKDDEYYEHSHVL